MVRRPLIFALFPAMLLHASGIAQDSVDPEEIIFAQRSVNTEDGHWYANIGYYADSPDHLPPAQYGKLCRMNLRTGEVTVLLDDPEGSIRDPQVHYSGKKIVFSYRRSGRADPCPPLVDGGRRLQRCVAGSARPGALGGGPEGPRRRRRGRRPRLGQPGQHVARRGPA